MMALNLHILALAGLCLHLTGASRTAYARSWQPPTATASFRRNDVALGAEQTLPTKAPWFDLDRFELLRRGRRGDKAVAEGQLCGYFPDEDFRPFHCAQGYTCTNIDHVRTCVRDGSTAPRPQPLTTACLGAAAPVCAKGLAGPGTLCCNFAATAPSCVTYLWSAQDDAGQAVFTQFNCDRAQFSGTYTLAASPPSTNMAVLAATTTAPPAPFLQRYAVSETPSETSSDTSPFATLPPAAPATEPLPASTIIGAVLGGVAALAAIALAGFFACIRLRHRRIRRRNSSFAPQPPAQPPSNRGMWGKPRRPARGWGGLGAGAEGGGDEQQNDAGRTAFNRATAAPASPANRLSLPPLAYLPRQHEKAVEEEQEAERGRGRGGRARYEDGGDSDSDDDVFDRRGRMVSGGRGNHGRGGRYGGGAETKEEVTFGLVRNDTGKE